MSVLCLLLCVMYGLCQQERRRALLLQLRVGLASCLRDLVKPLGGPTAAATAADGAAGAGGGGLSGGLGPGGSELLLLVGPDNHVSTPWGGANLGCRGSVCVCVFCWGGEGGVAPSQMHCFTERALLG